MKSKFSRIISGTMTWGQWGKQLSEEEMTGLIETTYELGINTFDHADIYGGYTTEAEFGAAFAQSAVAREQVAFITKCGIQYPSDTRPLKVKHYDYTPEHIRFSVSNSLQNLQTDYIDLLLLHRPSPLMDAAAIKWNQIQCSLTHTEALTNGELDFLQASDIGVMAWSPLGSYFKDDNPTQQRLRPLLKELQKTYAATEDQLLLAWLMQHQATIYPVVGTTQPERLKQSLAAESLTLDIQDWFRLYEASRGHRVA